MGADVNGQIMKSEDGTEFAVEIFAAPFKSEKDAMEFMDWLAGAMKQRKEDMWRGFEEAEKQETIN